MRTKNETIAVISTPKSLAAGRDRTKSLGNQIHNLSDACGLSRQAYSIEEFCQSFRICRATLYNLLKSGKGPRTMKVGSRTLISSEAATAWRVSIETTTAERTAP